MQVRTDDLIGPALDWAVAKCEGRDFELPESFLFYYVDEGEMRYSTDWGQGGPIIDREHLKLTPRRPFHDDWEAEFRHLYGGGTNSFGSTALIAAMRCYVAAKLGEQVDIPDELVTGSEQ